jgi:hypothetical protein
MDIAFVLYDAFTALDLVGPYEVIAAWPDARVRFVATEQRPVQADAGLVVMPTDALASLPDPDIVVIPGSSRLLGPLEIAPFSTGFGPRSDPRRGWRPCAPAQASTPRPGCWQAAARRPTGRSGTCSPRWASRSPRSASSSTSRSSAAPASPRASTWRSPSRIERGSPRRGGPARNPRDPRPGLHSTRLTGGGVQEPSSAEGPGQYRRRFNVNGPAWGVGSQLLSLSAPGDARWM